MKFIIINFKIFLFPTRANSLNFKLLLLIVMTPSNQFITIQATPLNLVRHLHSRQKVQFFSLPHRSPRLISLKWPLPSTILDG